MLMVKPLSSKLKRFISWLRTHKLASVALVLILLVVGFFVYEKVALELNKRAFQNARTAINAVYADIVKNVGPPDNNKHESSCSRPSQVYGQGPLSCDVRTSIIYGLSDKDQANTIFKTVQITMNQNKKFKSVMLEPDISSLPVGNSIYTSATDRYKMGGGIDCTMSYWYDTPRQTDLVINDKNKKTFEIILNCNGWARTEFYSMH